MSDKQTCITCKIERHIADFYKCSAKISGINTKCKQCKNGKTKEYRKRLKAQGIRWDRPKKYIDAKEKICVKCNALKEINCFNKNLRKKDKFSAHCKDCEKDIYIKRVENGMLERRKEINNKIKNEPVKIIKDNKKCYKCKQTKNIDEFYHNSRSRDKHASKCAQCTKNHNLANKTKIRENERKRHKADINFRLKRCVKASVLAGLKRQNKRKNSKSISKYLSYTMKQLKQHLEYQFESWMNWDNHGVYKSSTWDDNDQSTWKWHIDHIIPQVDLPYDSMEHDNFKKCWALENLRPLNAKTNILRKYKEI